MASEPIPVTSGSSGPSPAPAATTQPWRMLVCSDLGFSSAAPQQVLIAEWNEFFEKAAPRIRGTVPSDPGRPEFKVDFQPMSLDDLTPGAIPGHAPHLASLTRLRAVLAALADDNISPEEARTKVAEEQASGAMHERAIALLVREDGMPRSEISAEGVAAVLEHVDAMIDSDTSRCAQQPFYNDRRAAWHALRLLVSTAGRSGASAVYVCSGDRSRLTADLDTVLSACDQEGITPDIVLWDFGLCIEMADMKELSRLASICDRHHATLLASLHDSETQLEDASEEETFGHFMLQEQMVPFRRFRQNPSSRSVVVSAPTVLVDLEHPPAAVTGSGWLLAHDVQRMLIDGACPLDITMPSGEDLERNFQFTLSGSMRFSGDASVQAAESGLVLLSEAPQTAEAAVHSAINPDMAGGHLSLYGYNLLVNRLYRECERKLHSEVSTRVTDGDATRFRDFLVGLLAPYRLLVSDHNVRVTADGDVLDIAIDIDRSIGDYPIRFRVSV